MVMVVWLKFPLVAVTPTEYVPGGVPGFGAPPPVPPPLPPAPPQPAEVNTQPRTSNPNAVFQRRKSGLRHRHKIETKDRMQIGIISTRGMPYTVGLAPGTTMPAAVVVTMSVAGTPEVPVSATDAGLMPQLISVLVPGQVSEKLTVPLNPSSSVTVIVAVPELPGLEIMIFGGFEFVERTKSGVKISTKLVELP
jgi:hypothetical protein